MKPKSKRNGSASCIICCKPSTTNTHRSEILADNFPIIFFLRKLIPLPVSSSFCENLLKENGHPSSWFSFCGSCLMLVMKSQIVFSQIAQLQAEFKSLQSAVKRRILKSFEGSPNSDDKNQNQSLGCRERVRRTIAKKCGLLLNNSTEKEYGQRNFENDGVNNPLGLNGGDESYFTIKSYGTLCTDSHGRISIKPPPEKKNDTDEEMPPALIYYGKPRQSGSNDNNSPSLKNNILKRRSRRTIRKVIMKDDEDDDGDVKPKRGRRKRKVWRIRKTIAKKVKEGTVKVKATSTLAKKIPRPGRPKTQLKERKILPLRAETICPICHVQLTVLQLPAHIRNTHKEAGKTFKCDKCARGFFTSYELKIHIRRAHTGEKPYKCADCGKAYVDVSGLGRHRNKYGSTPNGVPKCTAVSTEESNEN